MQQLLANIQPQTPTPAVHPSPPPTQSLSPLQAALAAVAAAKETPSIRDRLRSAQRNLQWDSEMNGNVLVEKQ